MTNRLNPGQSLWFFTDPKVNRVQSALQMGAINKKAYLSLQSDGNAVLLTPAGQVLWASKTRGGRRLVMQTDGNLVILDGADRPLWATMTNRPGDPKVAWGGNPPYLVLQDDGNLVVYSGTTPLWSSQSQGFANRQDAGLSLNLGAILDIAATTAAAVLAPITLANQIPWVNGIVKTAGKPLGSAISALADASSSVATALASVPIIGPGLKGYYGLTYGAMFNSLEQIADGARLDKVVSRNLESQVQNIHDVAPYAQMVIALVPGVGPEVSGAISAGLALAAGKTIDQAAIDAVVGMVPGGPIAQMVVKGGIAVAQGKPFEEVAIAALPVPDPAKKALVAVAHITRDLADGKRVDQALLNEANKQLASLPPALQAAAQVGIALGQGRKLQEAALAALPAVISATGPLVQKGLAEVAASPVVAQARGLVDSASRQGFDLGTGLMKHAPTLSEINAIRNALSTPGLKKAFDMALALHAGQVTHPANIAAPPLHQAAQLITVGMAGAPAANKAAVVQTLIGASPVAKAGVIDALSTVTAARVAAAQAVVDAQRSLWDRFLEALGLRAKVIAVPPGATADQKLQAATAILAAAQR